LPIRESNGEKYTLPTTQRYCGTSDFSSGHAGKNTGIIIDKECSPEFSEFSIFVHKISFTKRRATLESLE